MSHSFDHPLLMTKDHSCSKSNKRCLVAACLIMSLRDERSQQSLKHFVFFRATHLPEGSVTNFAPCFQARSTSQHTDLYAHVRALVVEGLSGMRCRLSSRDLGLLQRCWLTSQQSKPIISELFTSVKFTGMLPLAACKRCLQWFAECEWLVFGHLIGGLSLCSAGSDADAMLSFPP